MSNDKIEVGAISTTLGLVVLSLPRGLVAEGVRYATTFRDEVVLNGVRFELRAPGPREVK